MALVYHFDWPVQTEFLARPNIELGSGQAMSPLPLQNLFIAQISGPAIGGGDGGVEFLVYQVKPGGALVVKVRERALLKLGGAIGVARFKARI